MSVTKKQSSLAIIAVVFATAMIAGTLVTSDNMAFAWKHKKSTKQTIAQENANNQAVNCNTAGGSAFATSGSGLLGAGATGGPGGLITLGSCSNTNTNINVQHGSNTINP